MRNRILVIVLFLVSVLMASADVTVKQNTNGKSLGISGDTTGTTYIKGNKMRSDLVLGDKTQTSIFDLGAQKMYIFDSKKKEADVWDMAAFAEQITKSVDVSNANASLKSNGQTKQIAGQAADGYDLEISMPSAMPGSKDMNMTVTLQGPVWIVKNAPGAADYSHFYKAAVEKGWIFSDPRAAKGQPGQAKAMAEMYKKISDIGGIAYQTDMQIKMSGSGPMAALFAKMGNMSFSTVVEAIETSALSDELFSPPAGYKLNPKK